MKTYNADIAGYTAKKKRQACVQTLLEESIQMPSNISLHLLVSAAALLVHHHVRRLA